MRKMTEAEKVKSQVDLARRQGLVADLTAEQWEETLNYFGHKCAYCGKEYHSLEHYLPLGYRGGGTTVSNCVPACQSCNMHKDAQSEQKVREYGNRRVRDFLTSRGATIKLHRHEFSRHPAARAGEWAVVCDTCGETYRLCPTPADAETIAQWASENICRVSK